MAYIVIVIYVICCFFALLEERMKQYRTAIYIGLGFLLVLVAGLRPVGIDPDSLNYENTFLNYTSPNASDNVEYSYILFSQIVNFFTDDVHVLFLFYALLGVGIKMYAFRKLSNLWFISLAIYISYYFTLHECIQIRTGVLSGLILIAIIQIADGKRKLAAVSLLIGAFFHYSSLAMLPILCISNKDMSKRSRIIWSLMIPLSYAFFFAGYATSFNYGLELPYVGGKLAAYQISAIKGLIGSAKPFGPFQLFTLCIYYYALYFYDTIIYYNKYFPIQIKIFTIGLFIYVTFSFLPVFAERVSLLYEIVSITICANFYYTVRPKWVSIGFIFILGIIYSYLSLWLIGMKHF